MPTLATPPCVQCRPEDLYLTSRKRLAKVAWESYGINRSRYVIRTAKKQYAQYLEKTGRIKCAPARYHALIQSVPDAAQVSSKPVADLRSHRNYEEIIGLELSLVPEVEKVFVDIAQDRQFRVTTIVNLRSPDLRKKIYAREKELMLYLNNLLFDFQIVERMDRELNQIVTGIGKLVFKRRE